MKPMTRVPMILVVVAGLLGLGSCSHSSSPTAPSSTFSPGGGPLTQEVSAALGEAIQDEYHAELTYQRALHDLGNMMPFSNIVNAEQRHSEAIARLYRGRGLAVPASQWTLDNVPRFRSMQRACEAAARAEIANIAMYDLFLDLELPNDVATVFQNNRQASLQNHLPAFQACRGPRR